MNDDFRKPDGYKNINQSSTSPHNFSNKNINDNFRKPDGYKNINHSSTSPHNSPLILPQVEKDTENESHKSVRCTYCSTLLTKTPNKSSTINRCSYCSLLYY